MTMRIVISSFILAVMLLQAHAAVEVAVLYNGEARLPASMQLGPWGSSERFFDFTPIPVNPTTFALPIHIQGRYQGTRLDFNPPLDTAQYLGKPDSLLELYLRAPDNTPVAAVALPKMANLRITFFTQQGIATLDIPVEKFYPQTEINASWRRIAIPLNSFTGTTLPAGNLERLLISADSPSDFLLGRIAFVRDVSRLQLRISSLPNQVRVGEAISFFAHVEADLTPYNISWDFGAHQQASIDATGESATFHYPVPGTYTVTATVTDRYGIKEPVTAQSIVTISD